jgi:hypothetical protein
MKTYAGQRKLVAGSALRLLLNYSHENLFVKSCYIGQPSLKKKEGAHFEGYLGFLRYFRSVMYLLRNFSQNPTSCLTLDGKQWSNWRAPWIQYNEYSLCPYSTRAIHACKGRDSVVGRATRYELDGPGVESWWGRDFQHPSRPALVPTQPRVQWVPGHSRG